MRRSIKLAMLVLLGSTAVFTSRAGAAAIPNLNGIRAAVDAVSVIDNVQVYVLDGRRYCWYDVGWQGPGWYWCGYAWRRGYGWGGGYGWQNWRWHGRSSYWRRGVWIGDGRVVVRPGGGGRALVGPGGGGRVFVRPGGGGRAVVRGGGGGGRGGGGPMGGGGMGRGR